MAESRPTFFGQYLVNKGVVTEDQLKEALLIQRGVNTPKGLPIGALAIERDYLEPHQVAEILAEQMKTDKLFGNLAVEMGLMNKEELDDLLGFQKKGKLFLGEALVEQGAMTREDLTKHLDAYTAEQAEAEEAIQAQLGDLPQMVVVQSFVDNTIKTMHHYNGVVAKVAAIETGNWKLPEMDRNFTQRVTGDFTFQFVLGMSNDLSINLASHMFMEMFMGEQLEVTPLVLDALSEFVNIVAGNGCMKLSEMDLKADLEPPEILIGRDHTFPGEAVFLDMSSTSGDFAISFVFERSPE